jgi:hypothetical protein
MPKAVDDDSYEDLLSLWSDLESGMGILLAHPASVQDFPRKIAQYDRWMQALLQQDTDASLYLLFQLATTSTVGYSTSHALMCAALCHITAAAMALPDGQRTSLVRAAMTMNIAMTGLQDTLALQKERPTPAQQAAIGSHAAQGRALLLQHGIDDPLWLDIVASHHQEPATGGTATDAARLAATLRTVDRYAAMISPRQSRAGGSAADSARAITAVRSDARRDDVSHALVKVVGLHPPGTFVRLDTGQVAVVLRRSGTEDQPLVASVLDAQGQPIQPPKLQLVRSHGPRIKAGLPRSAVLLELDPRTMVRLGIFAAARPKPAPRPGTP